MRLSSTVLNFGTNFVVPKCLVAEVSGSPRLHGLAAIVVNVITPLGYCSLPSL